MLIGIDGSRAFVKDRTGTENYSYQLLKAIAKVDTENKDLLQNSLGKILPLPRRTLRLTDAKHSYLIYLRPGQERLAKSENWPDSFIFKVINFPRLWTQLGLAIRTFLDPLDVLFVPSHTLPLIRKPGLKTVITVHDLGAEYLPGFHQLKQVLYLKLMTYYQLKGATKIIAVSEATKKDLIKKTGIKSEKISVVYEGVEDRIKSDSIRDTLKQYGLEKNKYFIFVGTLQPRKNLERSIKAFSKFLNNTSAKDFKLVLSGQKGWKYENIYSLPQQVGIEDNVVFTGRVSDQDLAVLYSQASALVYPSLFEGFGLPILEAYSYGCPVITSNISSMPEIAGNAALLVNPYKEDEIYSAMLKIVTNDNLRKGLIQKGSKRVKDFSWEKSAIETVEILSS